MIFYMYLRFIIFMKLDITLYIIDGIQNHCVKSKAMYNLKQDLFRYIFVNIPNVEVEYILFSRTKRILNVCQKQQLF